MEMKAPKLESRSIVFILPLAPLLSKEVLPSTPLLEPTTKKDVVGGQKNTQITDTQDLNSPLNDQ